MVLQTAQKFNWSGIFDNGDGSYTTKDKRAHRRLLKEFHRQGFQVRSKKVEGGGYELRAIGTNPRAGRYPARRIPIQRRTIRRGIPQRYGGGYHQSRPPRLRGPTLGGRAIAWGAQKIRSRNYALQKAQEKKIIEKKTEAATNEKMKLERIAQDREETRRALLKQELNRERLSHEKHEIAERLRDNASVKQTWERADKMEKQQEARDTRAKARFEQSGGGWGKYKSDSGSAIPEQKPAKTEDVSKAREIYIQGD